MSISITRGGGLATVAGLAGKFFNGDWRSTISTGNIGTLPLTTQNDSSNVTGSGGLPSADYRSGVNLWSSISYFTLGNNYGFIAIGYFTPPTTGTYTIYTASDDGSGVWIGDLALPGQTRTKANATLDNNMGSSQGVVERSDTISLTGGVRYPIRIVHEEGLSSDALTFSWSGPGIAKTTDLSTYFSTPSSIDNNNLLGDYKYFYNFTVGSNVVSEGRILLLDAGNTKSYPGSGTTWTDLSGQGNNATLNNGPTFDSANGGSIVTDGSNDFIQTSSQMLNPNSNFSVSFFVKRTGGGSLIANTSSGSFQIQLSANLNVVDSFVVNIGSFSNVTVTNTWYNLCLVRSGNTYTLYRNNSVFGSFSSSNSFTRGPNVLGKNVNTEFWAGHYGIVTCYNRALTAAEVTQNFNALRGRYGI